MYGILFVVLGVLFIIRLIVVLGTADERRLAKFARRLEIYDKTLQYYNKCRVDSKWDDIEIFACALQSGANNFLDGNCAIRMSFAASKMASFEKSPKDGKFDHETWKLLFFQSNDADEVVELLDALLAKVAK